MDQEDQREAIQLSEKERNLIMMIRRLGYGGVQITVKEGQPVRAEEVRKSVQL